MAELLADDSLDAVVELAGGIDEPLALGRATLSAGRAYVTGNKALLATHGGELAELAQQNHAALLGSASVGGGTPMIETVQHLATAGGITSLRGLLNATTTFILAAMGEGRSYDDALAEAQAAGYAEPDPTFDVTGRDAAQKIAILASIAWGRWLPEQEVATRGIVGIRVAPGETQRLMAEADERGVRVGPMSLGADDPMAGVSGIECLLEVQLRRRSRLPPVRSRRRRPGERPAPPTPTWADCWPASGRSSSPHGWPRERLADGRRGRRARRGRRRLPLHPGRCRPAGRPRCAPSGPRRRRSPTAMDRCPPGCWTTDAAAELDVLFLATDGATSRAIVEGPGRAVPLVVDNSSAFRLDPHVPLVVPEANGHALGRLRAATWSPTRTARPPRPWSRWPRSATCAGLESVDLASYQAVSGAGRAGVDAYRGGARGRRHARRRPTRRSTAGSPTAWCRRSTCSTTRAGAARSARSCAELRKILELPDLDVAATAVRVPVHTGHSVALHVRTEPRSPLQDVDGGAGAPRRASSTGPPTAASVTRCRSTSSAATRCWSAGCEPSRGASGDFALFLSSDNLRKGAALNAIQIAACADPDRFGRLAPPPR